MCVASLSVGLTARPCGTGLWSCVFTRMVRNCVTWRCQTAPPYPRAPSCGRLRTILVTTPPLPSWLTTRRLPAIGTTGGYRCYKLTLEGIPES